MWWLFELKLLIYGLSVEFLVCVIFGPLIVDV